MTDTNAFQVAHRARQYTTDNFLYMSPTFNLSDTNFLFEERMIDSLGVMELISFLEEEFGIQVKDGKITEENLGSVGAIGRFVSSKLSTNTTTPASAGIVARVPDLPPTTSPPGA